MISDAQNTSFRSHIATYIFGS